MSSKDLFYEFREAIREEMIEEINEEMKGLKCISIACGAQLYCYQSELLELKFVKLDDVVDRYIDSFVSLGTGKVVKRHAYELEDLLDCMNRSVEKLNKAIAEAE